jgi:hypothetical protein
MLCSFYSEVVGLIKALLFWFTNAIATFTRIFNPFWSAITMRLGFKNVKLALFISAVVSQSQAQCPDYTTYSQV